MIEQMTVFLENEPGRLKALGRTLGAAGVNMHALMIADTSDFGVVRIICDAPAKGVAALNENGYRASLTKVVAIRTNNRPNGFAEILEAMDAEHVNIEYAYCFGTPNQYAVSVLKITDVAAATIAIEKAGLETLQPEDLYAPDAV